MKCSLNRVKRGEVAMVRKKGKEVPEKRGRGAKQAQVIIVFILCDFLNAPSNCCWF